MPLEYENRRGDKYYVHEGRTKTGKPKFWCSKKAEGNPVEQLPEGFELHENPRNAQVTVRKAQTSRILPIERELLTKWVRELSGTEYFIVDVEEDSLVVYSVDRDPAKSIEGLARVFGTFAVARAQAEGYFVRNATYSPMFRFSLTDQDERQYCVQRWCYRGSIDRWMYLAGGAPLEQHARTFLPHLASESFFDLM